LEVSAKRFPLPWSHYVLLLKVKKPEARRFYETEAFRGGWTIRQLDRQVSTPFYERTLASRNKAAMLNKGRVPRPGESLTPEEEIKDPLVLEFLGLKDEYSETELEEALVRDLEAFLLELGGDFTFVGRQKRLRIDDEWYRIDLLFFHRALPGRDRPEGRRRSPIQRRPVVARRPLRFGPARVTSRTNASRRSRSESSSARASADARLRSSTCRSSQLESSASVIWNDSRTRSRMALNLVGPIIGFSPTAPAAR
jgi:predicted nuclease of restriction endonuclease-like (RecB) superfamily